MAWEARPEGVLDRWCVVEGERVVADDLEEGEARRIAASGETEDALEALVNALYGRDGQEGFNADGFVGPELRAAWFALLRSKGAVA